MIKISNHAKTKWLVRGDSSKRLRQAWRQGIKISLDNYSYDIAKLHSDSDTVILMNGGTVSTVLNSYETTEYTVRIPVECFDCGNHHHNTHSCPNCGSKLWRLRS